MTKNYFVIDFETTGLDPHRDYALQAGLTVLNGHTLKLGPTYEWDLEVPTRAFFRDWSGATKVNGITKARAFIDHTTSYESFLYQLENIRARYAARKESLILAAQGTHFDYRVLMRTYERAGVKSEWGHRTVDIPSVGEAILGVQSMRDISEATGIKVDPAKQHSAGYDSMVEAMMLAELLHIARAKAPVQETPRAVAA